MIEKTDKAKPRTFVRAYDKTFVASSAAASSAQELAKIMHGWLVKNAKLFGYNYGLQK